MNLRGLWRFIAGNTCCKCSQSLCCLQEVLDAGMTECKGGSTSLLKCLNRTELIRNCQAVPRPFSCQYQGQRCAGDRRMRTILGSRNQDSLSECSLGQTR